MEFGLELGRDVSLVEGGFLGCGATGVVYRGELRVRVVMGSCVRARLRSWEGSLVAEGMAPARC